MRSRITLLSAALLLVLGAAACGDESTGGGADEGNNGGNNGANNANNGDNNANNNGDDEGLVTYHRDLRPLIDEHCMACHATGGIAPAAYDLSSPEQVERLAPIIIAAVESGRMPPWQITDDCVEVQGSLRLKPEEVATFGRWMEDGRRMGDPADYVARVPRVVDIGAERLTDDEPFDARVPVPYTPRADRSDDFRCFVVDPGLTQTRYLTGFHTLVDNPGVLHHIVAFAVPGNASTLEELEEFEAEDAAPGYECFGSARTSNQSVIGAWAPGGGITGFPGGTAIPMDAGTRIVIQMHYNRSEGGDGADQSAMRFWFLPEGQEPEQYGNLIFIGNLPFEVPTGVNGTTADTCTTVWAGDRTIPSPEGGMSASAAQRDPEAAGATGCVVQDFYFRTGNLDLTLWGTFPHMHLIGKHIKVESFAFEEVDGHAVPMEDTRACLIASEAWDFDWQRAYWYQQPKTIPRNGMVRLTCRYDTTAADAPVGLGEGSGDEMCLGLLYLSAPVRF